MFKSLFGELGPPEDRRSARGSPADEPEHGFAATAILQSTDTELNARGQIVDRHSSDLVVTGSPAQAIREHFAASRSDLETATRQITLYDPASAWASAVIKALSDAAGGPIERLHLREHTTLRTLATIERTTLVRRNEDTLKIYNADVRAPGADTAEIPITLMERSHLAVVIVGPMQPHAIDTMLTTLFEAVRRPSWRCPTLLFMLPPSAVWIANKIIGIAWPPPLRVQVLNESLTSASAVWNALLGIWNHVKGQAGWRTADAPEAATPQGLPITISNLADPPLAPLRAPAREASPSMRMGQAPLDPQRAGRVLEALGTVQGLLGCAVVDSNSGLVLARHLREDHAVNLDLAGAAGTHVLRAHRLAARNMGLAGPIDEVITTAGMRIQLLRAVAGHPDLFLFALLDKQSTNLALARYKLMEAEKNLA